MLALKHVDDLKMCGPKQTIERFVEHLSRTFGELKIAWNSFVFCGVQHKQDTVSKEITLDQTAFIAAIRQCNSQR